MEQKSGLQLVLKVVYIVLLSAKQSVGAPALLPTQDDIYSRPENHDISSNADWPLDHPVEPASYTKELWAKLQESSTLSNIDDATLSNTVLWQLSHSPTASDITEKESLVQNRKAISEYSSTYLPSETEKLEFSGEITPFLLYKSTSPDSTRTRSGRMFVHPTLSEEHSVSSIPNMDDLRFRDIHIDSKFDSVISADESLPVTELIETSKTDSEKLDPIQRTTMSIKSVPNSSSSRDDSLIVIPQADISSSSNTSSNSSDTSLHSLLQIFNSNSQGLDKPVVNIPRLITRDLKNNSEAYPSVSTSVSTVASHNPDVLPLLPSPLPQLDSRNARMGKAENLIRPQPLIIHPVIVLTTLPSLDNPASFPFPPSSDRSDIMHGLVQGYQQQGPKSNIHVSKETGELTEHAADNVKTRAETSMVHHIAESMIREESDLEEDSDSKITWIKTLPTTSDIGSRHKETIPAAEDEPDNAEKTPLEDKEMGDGPYIPPEVSTAKSSADSDSKSLPIPSGDFILPSDKATSTAPTKMRGTEVMKVIPPMMTSSKVVNVTSQSGRTPNDESKSGNVPPAASQNPNSNTPLNISTDHSHPAVVTNVTGGKVTDTNSNVSTVPSSVSGLKQNVSVTTTASDTEENETTVVTLAPTTGPISNAGRVAAAAPSGSQHGLDAASITGISLGILVFAALVGAVSFVLYRRRFLNKPQTLNDKCSNPDSSGYIDDSTLRENSEEMYSLDNDSFLNSLEAMTIQNYWTDNVKHTKL